MVLLIASCVSVYHLQSWEHVLSCLKQSTFLLRAKAMKRLCHCGTNFPCKSDPEVNAWQPPSVMYLRSWNKGMCLQMSGCGFTWQFGMRVSGWICMYCQRQLHFIRWWLSEPLPEDILQHRMCHLNTGSPGWLQRGQTTVWIQYPVTGKGNTWQCSKQQNWMCRRGGGEQGEWTRGSILPWADFSRLHGS